MMKISSTAAQYLSHVRTEQGLPAESTVRITANATDGEPQQFSLGFVEEPPAGDEVGKVGDVTYCMDRDLAETTDSLMLDVDHGSTGPSFFLAEAGGPR